MSTGVTRIIDTWNGGVEVPRYEWPTWQVHDPERLGPDGRPATRYREEVVYPDGRVQVVNLVPKVVDAGS